MRFLVLPMVALLTAPAVAADYLGEVLAVSDGDTFTMKPETYALGSAESMHPSAVSPATVKPLACCRT